MRRGTPAKCSTVSRRQTCRPCAPAGFGRSGVPARRCRFPERRPPARVLAALLALLAACGGGAATRPLLAEYRVLAPRRQVVQPVWLASFTTDELYGRLAPDGRRLVYAGNQKGNLDIWVKDLSTGVPERLTSHVATDTQPAWSPDGEQVVFVSMRRDVKGDLYIWRGGELTQLTDRDTADSYPCFSPDGKSIYFAAGPEGMSRIERLDLGSRERTPITDWETTHPALSPDGKLLAFTQFDRERRGRIAVMDLASRKVRLLSEGEHHAGFPAFSRDGQRLLFSRFMVGEPGRPLTDRTNTASLWTVDLQRALRARPGQGARPITSGRQTALFVQDAGRGLVFTTVRAGSLDVGLLPPGGPFPRLKSADEQLALALEQKDPRDRLAALELTWIWGARAAAASRAIYLASILHRELGELDQARRLLERLVRESPLTHGEVAHLAAIDLIPLEAEAAHRKGKVPGELARAALRRLEALRLPDAPTPRVAAHLLLRRGDLQRLAGMVQPAIQTYETLVQRHADVRDHAVEAQLHLGALFARIHTPDLLATYYLTLFGRYPEQTEWLRQAARAVLALYEARPDREEIESLRALVDRHRDRPLFGAIAELRIARLYEQLGELDLAIAAMARITQRYPGTQLVPERTEAAFELGRLSLKNYERLRDKGRLSEALSFYDKALAAYAQVMKTFEPGHEHHVRARTEFLRLSLLMAAQLERDGEKTLAEKRYKALLEVEPDNVQAHRKLIQFGLARGERDKLIARYEKRLDENKGDFVGHYALGYLATFPEGGAALDASALNRAEEQLQQGISLNPRSPFGHMTLGWVFEMRERFLRQVARGHLEEAIVLYDRAYNLNDGRIDVQTEADLLVNQCNAFANLGNGWAEAYQYCERRQRLKLPFTSRERAATYHLTFGRAASATGWYKVADEQLELALELARDLDRPGLEAEASARLALNAHLQGQHARSNRYFEQATALFRKLGRADALAGLKRSVALNLARAGEQRKALEALLEARALLEKHGTPPIEPFTPQEKNCGKGNCTTAPYGFDRVDEGYLADAIRQDVIEQSGALPEVADLIKARIASRERSHETRGKRDQEELTREVWLLRNDLALTRLAMGDAKGHARELTRALRGIAQEQTDEETKELVPDGALFPLQTAMALNLAERTLGRLALGERVDPAEVGALLARLRKIEERRAAVAGPPGGAGSAQDAILPERLRLALWTDLALLTYHAARQGPPVAGALPPAERALRELSRVSGPFVDAVRLMRQVFAATDPERTAVQPEVRAALAEQARERGVAAPLWRPLSPRERVRWHVLAGLNLVQLVSGLAPRDRLETHPTTERLRALLALGLRRDLGALRFALAAELAYRRSDLRAMEAAVRGFLDRTPLLLDAAYPGRAPRIRRLIFGRAIALAREQKEPLRALAWAEQEERRAFADELAALPPAGWGRVAKPLGALLRAAAAHREQLAREPVDPPPSSAAGPTSAPAISLERAAWQQRLNALDQGVAKALATLRDAAPRIAALFEAVPAFPEKQLVDALVKDRDVAISAVPDGDRVLLIALAPGAEPRTASLPRGELSARLPGLLARLAGKATRAYVDLGRVDPTLAPEALLPKLRVARLATLWELVDARQVFNLALGPGLVVDPRPAVAKRVAGPLGLKTLAGEELVLKGLGRRLERAGVLLWSGPIRFDGGSAANLRLLLHDPDRSRIQDLRPARALGLPLRGNLLALVGLRHTPGRERIERVALLRLCHALGVPSVLLLPDERATPTLGKVLARLKQEDLAGAARSARAQAPYGHAGMEPDEAKAFAKKMLDAEARAGVGAFRKRALVPAVEHLEATLRYMAFLDDDKYLDGALEFLGQAYTLLEDYARAVPMMERLLALRAEAIAKAKKTGEKGKVLSAQAKWVKAVTDTAWLRMRNEQYDKALAANRQAIDLYVNVVKRPLLAQGSYDQRAIIAEKKGDNKQALEYARKALKTARAALGKQPSAAARIKVSDAALRVARYQRMLFSRYRDAMSTARLALGQLPEVKPEAFSAITDEARAMIKKKAGLKDKKQLEALTKQLKALLARRSAMEKALKSRLEVTLEISRIQAARGDYNRAAQRAEEALQIARQAGIGSVEEKALLELVNNLYYTGAYGPALARADQGLKLTKAPLRRIQFYNARGTVFAALGQTDDARRELGAALSIATRLDNATEMAASHNNLGNALRLAGRFDEARAEFRKALELDRQEEDKLGMAFDHANLGLTEELMGRLRSARDHLGQALSLSRKIGAPLNELKALAGLGRMDLAAGKAQPALALFQQGLKITERLGLRNWSWRFHLLAGRARRRLGQLDEAERSLRAGLAVVEHQPPRRRRALGAPSVEEEPLDVFDELIDLLAQRGKAEAAFDLSERLRARSFVDMVSQNVEQIPLQAVKELTARISALQLALEAARASREQEEVGKAEKAIAEARTALAALNPRLPDLVLPDAWPLARLRGLLPAGALLVSYVPTARRLVVFTLIGGKLQMRAVDVGRDRLTRAVQRYRESLLRFDSLDAGRAELDRWLVTGVLPRTAPERVLIVPGGPLYALPFEALEGDGHAGPLVDRHTISYLSSVNALRLATGQDKGTPRRVSFGWAGKGPRPLSFTVRESEVFRASFGAAALSLQGPEATRARFLEEAPKADLLHVATHAELRPDEPLATALELEGGELPLLEVLGLKLKPGALVLLSACETGTGHLDGADAVVGLNRAFLAAGAARVISSRWRVSDLGAALLMKQLFRGLARGQTPARALRRAQNLLRRRFPHPAFWAGFQLDGAP